MNVMYKSTRSDSEKVTASQAILRGLAEDGGLYVPDTIPALELSLDELSKLSYQETAYEIMKLFFTDFSKDELQACINNAYDNKFDTKEIVNIVKKGDVFFLELFHGSTIAFKDMALSILPYLLTTAAKKNNVSNEIVILTATSGDTGKAALAGFANVEGTSILVYYPKNGVSPIQEKQMITQKGDNTNVIGVAGNFDDTQTGVKEIFGNKELVKKMEEAGYQFSSANSINIGRLIPQVVYYVYTYGRLLNNSEIKEGEAINVVVPTGNFGNILAAYYAKQMGLPIDKLICASNENKVLFDFFETGKYNRKRDFVLTSSPSMDILISSNLERLLYKISGESSAKTLELMELLSTNGEYEISSDMKEQCKEFYGGYATENEVNEMIQKYFKNNHYVLDTHTAVAAKVYEQYKDMDNNKCVIVSTASPYKFTHSVMEAIEGDMNVDQKTGFELVDELQKLSGVKVPNAIEEIRTAPVLHTMECDKATMQEVVENILNI